MSMMREDDIIRTAGMTVEEKLGALVAASNVNNREFLKSINELGDALYVHQDALHDHQADISELFNITKGFTKKLKGKASKFGLALAVIGGIVYIVKNEKDKDNMRTKLLEFDKQERGCYCSIKEDEGEALDGEGPLGI